MKFDEIWHIDASWSFGQDLHTLRPIYQEVFLRFWEFIATKTDSFTQHSLQTGVARNFCLGGPEYIPYTFHHNSSSKPPQLAEREGYPLLQYFIIGCVRIPQVTTVGARRSESPPGQISCPACRSDETKPSIEYITGRHCFDAVHLNLIFTVSVNGNDQHLILSAQLQPCTTNKQQSQLFHVQVLRPGQSSNSGDDNDGCLCRPV